MGSSCASSRSGSYLASPPRWAVALGQRKSTTAKWSTGGREGMGLIKPIPTTTSPKHSRPVDVLSSLEVWVNITALPCVKCAKRCWIRCKVRCDISTFWGFPVTRGKNVPHSSYEWVGVNNYQNRTKSAWTHSPKKSSKATSLAVQLLDNNCVSDTLFCSNFEATKLIIKNNSCKDCSSLPTVFLRLWPPPFLWRGGSSREQHRK